MRRHGSYGQVLMDPAPPASPAPPVPVAVASLNKWTLDAARDRADVTAFGDRNKVYVQGLPDMKGTLGGFFDAAEMALFDVAFGEEPAFLKLVPSSLDPLVFFSGLAYIDAGIDVDAGGAVTINGSWTAAGEWTRDPESVVARRAPAPGEIVTAA